MKIIEINETENYKEIKLEYKFLWKTYTNTYRKIGRSIYEYTPKNYYRPLGISSYCDISPYFNVKELE